MYRELPERTGSRPATTSRNPHRQLEQNAPCALQEALWMRMCTLPDVEIGPSRVSVPGARATFLPGACGRGPTCAYMIEREFAHLHPPDDGSLHLTLPRDMRDEAIAKGWAEPHPLAGGVVPATVVMVYGPRDAHELEVVWSLVVASDRFAREPADVGAL